VSIKPPVYRQEKNNTCGLACLRMVLVAYGQEIVIDTQKRAIGHFEMLQPLFRSISASRAKSPHFVP
jgi:ABC-type bacteriocin/lantibiotic exporter with double-glycine peptidase domain